MALINKVSRLSKFNGQTPPKSNGQVPLDPTSLAQSQLDLDGVAPTGPLNDPSYGTINNSFSKGKYLDNLPE